MSAELDHLGIAVRSMAEGLRLYEDLLGMAVSGRESVPAESVAVVMLAAGGSPGAARIELLEGTDCDSPITKFIEKRGPGLHHIALRVDDLLGTVEAMKAQGAAVLNEPRTGAGGHLYVFVHPKSAGGVLLELVQK